MSHLAWYVSAADIVGPWSEPNWESGLVERCRRAWNKPLGELSNEELATFLRQRIATAAVLIVAEVRLQEGRDDGTEMFDGELAEAVSHAKKEI